MAVRPRIRIASEVGERATNRGSGVRPSGGVGKVEQWGKGISVGRRQNRMGVGGMVAAEIRDRALEWGW